MGSSSFSEFCLRIPGWPMSTPRFAGKGSDISSCLCSISRSVFCKCTPLWIRTRCVQQIRESRSMFQLEAMELQCNQGGDWLGAPPRIPVIFGAYMSKRKCPSCQRASIQKDIPIIIGVNEVKYPHMFPARRRWGRKRVCRVRWEYQRFGLKELTVGSHLTPICRAYLTPCLK